MNNLDTKKTRIYIDIHFRKDGQNCHLLNFEFDPDEESEETDLEFTAFPSRLSFSIDKTLETNDEIAEAVVNYLSSLRLYLHSYHIKDSRMFVAYERKEPAFNEKLTYSPAHQTLDLFIEADAQTEDGVNYDEELGIKLHHPVDKLSLEEIERLNGSPMSESGVKLLALISENELPDEF